MRLRSSVLFIVQLQNRPFQPDSTVAGLQLPKVENQLLSCEREQITTQFQSVCKVLALCVTVAETKTRKLIGGALVVIR